MSILIIETFPVDDTKEYRLLDTDVKMLLSIKDCCGLITAIKVARLMMPGIGLKQAADFVRGL